MIIFHFMFSISTISRVDAVILFHLVCICFDPIRLALMSLLNATSKSIGMELVLPRLTFTDGGLSDSKVPVYYLYDILAST